jgi:hypothetical protein
MRSRDIEPMKGGHRDNYYYQMASNIRRYKGVNPPEPPSPARTITIDGSTSDWKGVKPVYETPKGNTRHRNHPGWNGVTFTNNTGRNDFVKALVAGDHENIYFCMETAADITPASDPAWMRLLIDTDRKRETGWEGYDFVLNRTAPTDAKITVERCTGGWNWEKCGEADYKAVGKFIELKIPRTALSLHGRLNFEFKWSDNMQQDGDIMDFYLSGDVAPAGRFNFIYKEKE